MYKNLLIIFKKNYIYVYNKWLKFVFFQDDGSLLAALSSEELKIPLKSPKLPHVVMKVALLSVTVWKFSDLRCSEIPWKKVKLPKGESFAVCSLGNGGHLEWNKFCPTMLAVHNVSNFFCRFSSFFICYLKYWTFSFGAHVQSSTRIFGFY